MKDSLGKAHIVGLMAVILGGIYWIGTSMDWANTTRVFYQNNLSNITSNQLQQQIIAWAYWFFWQQQIVILPNVVSIPVIAFIVIIAGVMAYIKSKR